MRIVQLVRFLREGEPVIMPKRAADLVTLREMIGEVVAYFISMMLAGGGAFGLAPDGGNLDSLWMKDFGRLRPARNALD